MPHRVSRAPRHPPRLRRRALQASRLWRSCRSRPSRSRSTTPTAGSCAPKYLLRHHGTQDAGPAIFAVVEKNKKNRNNMASQADASMPNMQRITMNGIVAARRAAAGICGLARLRADALWLCREGVRQDADRDARDHLADCCRAGRVLASGAAGAEGPRYRGRADQTPGARPRGGRGCQDGRRGEEAPPRRRRGGRGADRGAAQAGGAQAPRRRCARRRRQGARHREDR